MWNIEKIIKKGDYLYAIVRDHPNKTKNNYVLHHRIVMENHLGRLLTQDEIVHHIDGNKHNNEITNLQLMTNIEHTKHHVIKGRSYVECICHNCKKIFLKEKRFLHSTNKYIFCSRSCNGKYHAHYMRKGRS